MSRSTIASGHVSDLNELFAISPIGFVYLREVTVNPRAAKVDRNVRMYLTPEKHSPNIIARLLP